MTVLSSKEGKFYDVPDDVLKKHEVPAQRVKEILAELDSEMGPGGGGASPAVVIHVSGSGAYIEPMDGEAAEEDVEPYGRRGRGRRHRHGHHGGGHHHGGHGPWFSPYWPPRPRYYYYDY